MTTDDKLRMYSDAEARQVIIALAKGHGSEGITAEDAAVALSWMNETRVMAAMLKLVLEDKTLLRIKDGELVFVTR